MRDTMQSALQPPDLSVWERTLLPTTSSRIVPLRSGNSEEILSVVRSSGAGDTEFRVTRFPDGTTGLIELSSSHPEVSWNSYHDTQKSSPPMRCPSYTLESTGQRAKLEHVSEEILDESTLDAWRRTLLIFGTTLGKMVSGSSHQILSWIVSTIRRTTN